MLRGGIGWGPTPKNRCTSEETPETDFYFNGAIDDIRIYDRALGEAEIQSLLV